MKHSGNRINNYHTAKSQIVGHAAARPAPAWKASNLPQGSGSAQKTAQEGSKILMSNLPPDVSEEEIVDLMKKTIGPVNLTQTFMVYNVKGFPQGKAIVQFVRAGDATKARDKYNGKVIDGRRAIKLELIVDRMAAAAPATVPKAPKVKSLSERISTPQKPATQQVQQPPAAKRPVVANGIKKQVRNVPPVVVPMKVQTAPRIRQKKGPRRVKKSAADLDREMDEYLSARPEDDLFQNVGMAV